MIYYIYSLKDPITNKIRYIGKTTNIQKRYYYHCSNYHLNNENTHRSNWIKSLKNQNLKPIIEIIEECENWQEREIYWIKYHKDLGYDLCNHTIGGDGGKGFSQYKEFKVYQYDKSGKLLNIYNSTREASLLTSTKLADMQKCLRGLYKTANNYHWSKNETFTWKNKNHNAKTVLKLDINNNILDEYDSITEAANSNNIQRNSIKNCCLGVQKTAGKFKWKYKNEE